MKTWSFCIFENTCIFLPPFWTAQSTAKEYSCYIKKKQNQLPFVTDGSSPSVIKHNKICKRKIYFTKFCTFRRRRNRVIVRSNTWTVQNILKRFLNMSKFWNEWSKNFFEPQIIFEITRGNLKIHKGL